jgi:hypothetical protein
MGPMGIILWAVASLRTGSLRLPARPAISPASVRGILGVIPTPLPHVPCHFLFVHHSQEAFAQKLGTHSLPPGTSLWVQYVQIVCLGLLSIRVERRSGCRKKAASEVRVSASPLPVRSEEFCGRAAVTAARSARPGDHTQKGDHHWPFSRRPIFHRKREDL